MRLATSLTLAIASLPLTLGEVWQVEVGPNGQLTYYPEYVIAEVGDQVNFNFQPKNHTVTQSSFDQPCVPLPNGFNSGFQPTAVTTIDKPNFIVTVNDTNPIWVHCEQKGHCGAGMVFAINPPAATSNHSFAAFKALAIAKNGTAAASASSSYSTPPPQSWATATATVTKSGSTYLTTYTSYDGTPQPTYALSGPVTHNITVGFDGQLAFGPQPNITAAIGDIVSFTFLAKNHSVQQSSFSNPCVQLEGGFNLGFHPVAANTTGPTLSITINNTAPIWGFCGQTSPVDHCGSGMVFSINAVESGPNNFEAFQLLAEHINGTSAAGAIGTGSGTSSAPGSSSSSGGKQNGAVSGRRAVVGGGVGMALGFVAAIFVLV